MDTILTDTSTKITQNEVTLTEVHGENINVTNHDYGWRFHFRDKLNTKKIQITAAKYVHKQKIDVPSPAYVYHTKITPA